MGRLAGGEEIQEIVVLGVDEELGSAGVGATGISLKIQGIHSLMLYSSNGYVHIRCCTYHGQSADFVGVSGASLHSVLIGDGTITVAGDSALARNIESGARGGSASAGSGRLGVSGVRAAELVHEVGNHTVESEAIVETLVGKIDEVV